MIDISFDNNNYVDRSDEKYIQPWLCICHLKKINKE